MRKFNSFSLSLTWKVLIAMIKPSLLKIGFIFFLFRKLSHRIFFFDITFLKIHNDKQYLHIKSKKPMLFLLLFIILRSHHLNTCSDSTFPKFNMFKWPFCNYGKEWPEYLPSAKHNVIVSHLFLMIQVSELGIMSLILKTRKANLSLNNSLKVTNLGI